MVEYILWVFVIFMCLCISYFFSLDEMEGGGLQLGEWKPVDDLQQQAEAHWELKAKKSLWKHQREQFPKKTLKNNFKENIEEQFARKHWRAINIVENLKKI